MQILGQISVQLNNRAYAQQWGNTELGGSKLQKWNGFWKPNFGVGPSSPPQTSISDPGPEGRSPILS